MKLPDSATLEAVGRVLGRELGARDARIVALEQRAPVPGPVGPQGERGERGEPGAAITGAQGERGERGEAGAPGRDGQSIVGPAGPAGERGERGHDGAGLDSPAWRPGVYRAGAIVQHHIGQHFRARVDTAAEPPGEEWERLGGGGFRLVGGFKEGATYLDGDLFVRDFGLFCWSAGAAHLWAGRGARGERGERGPAGDAGEPGRDGLDGCVVEAAELRGHTLVFVQRGPSGRMSAIEVDLMPFLQACAEALRDRMAEEFARLEATLDERVALAMAAHAPPTRARARINGG